MVCDSIHQLSHGAPTKKPNTKIAEFIGVDEISVRRAKTTLREKGLVEEVDGGWTTTEKWAHVVTYMPIRQNVEDIRQNVESHNIYIKNNNCDSKESRGKQEKKSPPTDLVVTPVDGDGNPVAQRKPAETTRDAPKVFALFKDTIGNYNPAWLRNKTERRAAQSLFETRGMEKIEKALRFWLDHKDDQYIPEVFSPHKLETKWDSLVQYRKKNGL